jgi:hypothetical protein
LALIFLLRGKWRVLAGLAAAGVALAAVSVIAVGPAGIAGYVNLLVDTMRHPSNPAYRIRVEAMPNLRGFFHGLAPASLPNFAVMGVVVLVSLFLLGYVAWRWRRQDAADGPAFDLMFAAALITSQVTAYYLFIHDLSPALVAVLLIVSGARYPEGSRWKLVRNIAVAAIYVLPACLLRLPGEPLFLLAPVLVLLAWVAMQGSALECGRSGYRLPALVDSTDLQQIKEAKR